MVAKYGGAVSGALDGSDTLGQLGLSIVHISPREVSRPPGERTLRVHQGGGQVRLTGSKRSGGVATKSPGRGSIRCYSPASRRRLMRALDSIDQAAAGLPAFVTLTYPGEYPGEWRTWKRHLDTWLKRLRRKYPGAWGVWRMEPQRRGAPHYHLLVFGCRLDRQWVSASWFEVVGSGDERHLRAGTKVESVRAWNGVKRYTAKYLAKTAEELPPGWEGVGRWWAWFNQAARPIHPVEYQLDAQAFNRIKRVMRKAAEKRGFKPWRGKRELDQNGQQLFSGFNWTFAPETARKLAIWARGQVADLEAVVMEPVKAKPTGRGVMHDDCFDRVRARLVTRTSPARALWNVNKLPGRMQPARLVAPDSDWLRRPGGLLPDQMERLSARMRARGLGGLPPRSSTDPKDR